MPTADVIQARIDIAARQKEVRDEEYDNYLRLYTNDWVDGKMNLAPNIIHSSVRQLVSTVIFDDPEFDLKAMSPKYHSKSIGATAYVNWLWSQIEANEQTELVVTDAIVYPIGYWKLGMGRAYQSERQLEKLLLAEEKARLEQEMWMQGEFNTPVDIDDRHASHIPMHLQWLETPEVKEHPLRMEIEAFVNEHVDVHGTQLTVTDTTLRAEQEGEDPDKPFLYRVSPRNIYPGGNEMMFNQSRYVLEVARFNYDEWKANPAYDHRDIEPTDIAGEARDTFDEMELERTKTERGMGVIDIWHHIDKFTGEWSSWVRGEEKPVRAPQPQFYRFMKGFPYEPLRLDVCPEKLHGPGLVARLEHAQKMDMDIAHRLATHARNATTKWVMVRDRLAEPENHNKVKKELQDSEMDSVIDANDERVLVSVPPAPLDPIYPTIRGMLREAVQEAVGLSDPSRGVVTGATATEIRQAASGEGVVMGTISKKLKTALQNIVKKLLAISREFGPDEQILPLFGTREEWVTFKRQDLAGDYQIAVNLPLPGDKQNELANVLNALQQLRASANFKGEGLKRLEVEVLRKLGQAPELYDLDAIGDARGLVVSDHKAVMNMQPPESPMPDQDITYHLKEHNKFASDLERQLMMFGQITQEVQGLIEQGVDINMIAQQAPQVALALQQQQMVQQQLQLMLQHIEETMALEPSAAQGRRRNALLLPDGNPGTRESIRSNEIMGT